MTLSFNTADDAGTFTFSGASEWSRIDDNGSLASRIADQLAEAIVSGDLKSGTILAEPEIAKAFGVSRTSVREALYMLEHDELVARPARRSARVATVTEKQALDIYICRAYLYGLSARMCVAQLTEGDLSELCHILSLMDAAVDRDDTREYYRLNLAFHGYLGEASGNEMLLKLMVSMGKRTLRFRYMSLTISGVMAASLSRHHLLMEELIRRDAEAAERRVREIVSSAGDAVLMHFFGNPSLGVSKEVMNW